LGKLRARQASGAVQDRSRASQQNTLKKTASRDKQSTGFTSNIGGQRRAASDELKRRLASAKGMNLTKSQQADLYRGLSAGDIMQDSKRAANRASGASRGKIARDMTGAKTGQDLRARSAGTLGIPKGSAVSKGDLASIQRSRRTLGAKSSGALAAIKRGEARNAELQERFTSLMEKANKAAVGNSIGARQTIYGKELGQIEEEMVRFNRDRIGLDKQYQADIDALAFGKDQSEGQQFGQIEQPQFATQDFPVIKRSTPRATTGTAGVPGAGSQQQLNRLLLDISRGAKDPSNLTEAELSLLSGNTAQSQMDSPIINMLKERRQEMETRADMQRQQREEDINAEMVDSTREAIASRMFADTQTTDAAMREKDAITEAIGAGGFGSSRGAELIADVDKQTRDIRSRRAEIDEINKGRLERQLRGQAFESDQQVDAQLAQMDMQLAQEQSKLIQSTRAANAANGIKGLEAAMKMRETLLGSDPAAKRKTNTFMSDQLGYLVDDYGQPTMTDENGQPIKTQDDTRWAMYQETDPYTQEMTTYFYDPKNPNRKLNEGEPRYKMAQSQDTSNVQAAGIATNNNDNCVFFARELTGLPYTGGDGINYKKDTIKKYGSDDVSGMNVGDNIFTNEGTYGHVAVVTDIDTDTGMVTLLEANRFKDEDGNPMVTRDRKINMEDPMVMGYVPNMKGTPLESNNFSSTNEGNNQTIDDTEATQDPTSDFKWTLAEHSDMMKTGTPPQFRGRSQKVKDDQEAEFRKEYQKFRQLNDSGQVELKDYNPEKYRTLIGQAGNSVNARATTASYKIQGALKKYRDAVEQYGSVEWNNPIVAQRYGDLQIAWKELAKLGVLAGPDMGIIESVIPPINAWTAPLKASLPGDRQKQILDAIDDQSDTIAYNAQRNVETLRNTYPDLRNDDFIRQLEAESRVTVNNLSDIDKASAETAKADFEGVDVAPNMVRVVSPDGTPGTVPANQLDIFLKNDFTRVD